MDAVSLFGWPSQRQIMTRCPIEVMGVPSDAGNSTASGARLAPAAIRRASCAFACDVRGIDLGDIKHLQGEDWEDGLRIVESAVAEIFNRGSLPLILGGDHAISYAGIAAARQHSPLNIVWFDAHTDFCTWRADAWHNHKQVLRRISSLGHVGTIVQIGHRGITYIDEAQSYDRLTVVNANDAQSLSVNRILDHLPVDEPIYMSIDIDVLDLQYAPGTGHPVPGGLTVARLAELARGIAYSRRIIALDLMEVNPLLDYQHMTSTAAATVLAELAPVLAQQEQRLV